MLLCIAPFGVLFELRNEVAVLQYACPKLTSEIQDSFEITRQGFLQIVKSWVVIAETLWQLAHLELYRDVSGLTQLNIVEEYFPCQLNPLDSNLDEENVLDAIEAHNQFEIDNNVLGEAFLNLVLNDVFDIIWDF